MSNTTKRSKRAPRAIHVLVQKRSGKPTGAHRSRKKADDHRVKSGPHRERIVKYVRA